MLFRATIALFVLFLTLPSTSSATGKGSEITIVGPTENTAAFIAVRPVAMPMQPGISPVSEMMTTGTPAAEEPEMQTQVQAMPTGMPQPATEDTMIPQPAAEEPAIQSEMQPQTMTTETPQMTAEEPQMQSEMMTGSGEETMGGEPMHGTSGKKTGRGMTTIMPVSARGEQGQMHPMLRGVITRMRGRRLQRRAAVTPTVTTQERPTMERPTMERPTMERPTMERPTMERPTMERPTMERSTMERPMTTPEMYARAARFNTVIGDIELSREMLEAQQATPESATRDTEFNTFVGRLRIGGGRWQEPQWEQVWMPRGRRVY